MDGRFMRPQSMRLRLSLPVSVEEKLGVAEETVVVVIVPKAVTFEVVLLLDDVNAVVLHIHP